MGLRHINRFLGHPPLRAAWEWFDSENADTDLVSFFTDPAPGQMGDLAVDRSGATPKLIWQIYEWGHVGPETWDYGWAPTSVWDEIGLEDGVVVIRDPGSGLLLAPNLEAEGYWFSDEHGRPYSLNDLLADTP